VRSALDVNHVNQSDGLSRALSAGEASGLDLTRARAAYSGSSRPWTACDASSGLRARAIDLTAFAVVNGVATDSFPHCAVAVPVDLRPDFGRLCHTPSARQAKLLGLRRRSHVNDVKPQQQQGLTTSTSHKGVMRSRLHRGCFADHQQCRRSLSG
jgi:hypothetical protein